MILRQGKQLTLTQLQRDAIARSIGHWQWTDENLASKYPIEFTINKGAVHAGHFDDNYYILAQYSGGHDAKGTLYDTPSVEIIGYGSSLSEIITLYKKYLTNKFKKVGGLTEHHNAYLHAR